VNLEWGAAGDTRYAKADYQYQQFIPLTNRFTLGFNGEIGYGRGLDGQPYPVFKNFYGGGLGTVRGFEQNSLGPVDIEGAYIGGNKRVNLNTELYVPFPGAGNDRTLRLFGYVDAGNVWGEDERIRTQDLRASVGVGISWVSPVGPLKLSYGKPFRYFDQDKIQKLQFQIGSVF
jgi:outer membrane protein insertion porin family